MLRCGEHKGGGGSQGENATGGQDKRKNDADGEEVAGLSGDGPGQLIVPLQPLAQFRVLLRRWSPASPVTEARHKRASDTQDHSARCSDDQHPGGGHKEACSGDARQKVAWALKTGAALGV